MDLKKTIYCLFISVVVFSGCSVRYTQRIPGFQPGYVDEQIGDNTFQVRIGEAWPKDWPNLEKFALYRAADVTKSLGRDYFTILGASSQVTSYTMMTPTTTQTNITATKIGNTVYGQANSVSQGGNQMYIQGGWYYMDYKVLDNTAIGNYENILNANTVINNLKYFIDSRR